MSDFHFKRLEKYKVGGTDDRMELEMPLPNSPTGKVYRWCPNIECVPRLFLLGKAQRPEKLDNVKLKRSPGTKETTCPYCGIDAADSEFTYSGDMDAIHEYMKWAVHKDTADYLSKMASDFNRSQSESEFFSVKMEFDADNTPEPRAWREDLIRNLACDICGREYGVYAIALFCPDCGSRNLHIHFEREIEIIIKEIDIAEQVAESNNNELSYRILGNAHEDVVTAFETYQKTSYKYLIKKNISKDEADKLTNKGAIGNKFQNITRSRELYSNLSFDPFNILTPDELELLKLNIEKRHVIGHNLSMADETYSVTDDREKPGITINLLGDEVSEFAKTAKKVVIEIENHLLL